MSEGKSPGPVGNGSFPCTGCGACCRNLRPEFDLPTLSDGRTCVHLHLPTGRCQIYERRPAICRIDELFKVMDHEGRYTEGEWHLMNALACAKLIRKEGIDPSLVPEPKLVQIGCQK